MVVDSFTISWKYLNFYAFPPFSLVLRVLKKIVSDKAQGILVVPLWSSQAWYNMFSKMLVEEPLCLGPQNNLLSSQGLGSSRFPGDCPEVVFKKRLTGGEFSSHAGIFVIFNKKAV